MSIHDFANHLEGFFKEMRVSSEETDNIQQIVIDNKYHQTDYAELNKWNVESRAWGADQTLLDFTNSNHKIFLRLSIYQDTLKAEDFKNDFLLLNEGNTSIWKSQDQSFTNDELGDGYELINSYLFKKFKSYLTDTSNEDSVSHLITYVDRASSTMLYTSLNSGQNFKVKIRYNKTGYEVERLHKQEISHGCVQNLLEKVENPDFATLLKNNIVKILNVSATRDLYSIFNKCEYLLKETINDHKLFISRFTFESFINELNERKEAYFNRIKNQLQHINNKLFSLVVSLSALFVGLYNTKDISVAFVSLVVVYYFYAMYIFVTNIFTEKEYLSQQNIFQNDYKFIREKSGIDENEIKRFRKYIQIMFQQLNFSIWCVYIIFSVIIILLIPFSVKVIGFNNSLFGVGFLNVFGESILFCAVTVIGLWIGRYYGIKSDFN